MNRDNGKIRLNVKGGVEPYTFEWVDKKYKYGDQRIYEAEKAAVSIPGYSIKNYFDASNKAYISFNGDEGTVTWKVEVANAGIYPVDIIYASISPDVSQICFSVNGEEKVPVTINTTRPLYSGWDKATVDAKLKTGLNWITLSHKGSRVQI